MRYVLETVTSAKAVAELRSPAVDAQHPCLHAALWRGSIFLPFMSPDKQQQPRCLDQWFVNFHTRLRVAAVQRIMDCVLFKLVEPKTKDFSFFDFHYKNPSVDTRGTL